MYNIIPLILILLSLSVIIYIVLSKFSALASLDIDNMPAEKEARVKEHIISSRLKREIQKRSFWIVKIFRFLWKGIAAFGAGVYEKMHNLKAYHKEEVVKKDGDSGKRAEIIHNEVDELLKKEEFDLAENLLIELLAINSKDIDAFKKLGGLYFERKDYEDAKQTFEHILKITPEEDGEIYFDLCLVYMEMENWQKAIDNIKKALEIEPNNPRYLDTMVEIGIINKDKVLAQDAYNRLAEANPENQKLGEIKEEIDNL